MASSSQVESIFFAALETKAGAERAAYLDEACGADAALRLRVEQLLEAHPLAVDFLAEPAVDRHRFGPGFDPNRPFDVESWMTHGNNRFPPEPTRELEPPKAEDPAPLRAVHTPNFPALLRQLGASLLVTTYQAGKLVLVRDEGDHLNTHFRGFQAPMGMALAGDRLAVGTAIQVWEFVDVPAVTAKLEPPGRHDGCFLPRSSHVTGNIQIHEMAWGAGNELWVVNTRFSCLCTLDGSASFAPRWRPPFVSALEPTDRCHLNGLAMKGGRPRYVTALGETDEPAGWRENKARGGIVMDVDSGEVITRGLSMPHSPRWYGGRLWVCESGAGTFGSIDPNTRKYVPIAEVPGFTRGVDFADNLAFVGLSQVRESAVFSGIAITERLTEEQRTCGVCVIDLTTGQVIGLLRFETAVQEVFAVTVLPGRRYPELINDDEKLLENSFVVPDAALADVPASLRAPAGPTRGAAAPSGNGSVPRESFVKA